MCIRDPKCNWLDVVQCRRYRHAGLMSSVACSHCFWGPSSSEMEREWICSETSSGRKAIISTRNWTSFASLKNHSSVSFSQAIRHCQWWPSPPANLPLSPNPACSININHVFTYHESEDYEWKIVARVLRGVVPCLNFMWRSKSSSEKSVPILPIIKSIGNFYWKIGFY